MFWIPYASLFIFVVTLVISIILGYKRGWKSALFIALVFFALNGAVIGIEVAIYNSTLWDLYKNMFMKNEMGVNGIDYDVLKPYYKVRAILIFAGLLSPITYAITLGIYFALKKPLTKYLMPRVKEVSSNEKELIYRKNPLVAKITGATISATTGIFAASFFASAANIVATPRENQNGFNKFNDVLGRIYGLGMAGNTEETKAISQFLTDLSNGADKDGNSEFVKSVQSLIDFDDAASEFKTMAVDAHGNPKLDDNHVQITRNTDVKNQIQDFDFLFQYEDATKAIFSAIVSKVNTASFNVLNFGFNEIKDANDNAYGQSQTINGGTPKINTFSIFVAGHNIIDSDLPVYARQALLDKLVSGLSLWKDTAYFIQLQQAKDQKDAQQNVVTELKGQLTANNNYRAQEISNQSSLISNIAKYAGFTSAVETTTNPNVVLADGTNPVHSEVQTVGEAQVTASRSNDQQDLSIPSFDIHVVPNINPSTGDVTIAPTIKANTIISNSVVEENRLWANVISAAHEYNSMWQAAFDYNRDTFTPMTNERNRLQGVVSTKTQDYQRATDVADEAARKVSGLESQVNAAQVAYDANVSRLNLLDTKLIPNKKNEITNTSNDLASKLTLLNSAKTASQNAQTELGQANGTLANLKSDMTRKDALITDKKAEITAANDELKKLNDKLATINDPKSPEWIAAEAAVKAQQTVVSDLQKALSVLNDEKTALQNKINQAETDVRNKTNTSDQRIREQANAQNAYDASNSKLTQLNNELSTLNNESLHLTTSNPRDLATLNSLKQDLVNANGALQTARSTQASKKNELDVANRDLQTFLTSATGSYSYGWNKANEINEQNKRNATQKQMSLQSAWDRYSNQRNSTNEAINKVNNDLTQLKSVNANIRSYNTKIDFLMDRDPKYAFDASVDHASWTKTAEPDDEKSIYYAEQYLQYWNNKVSQRQNIFNEMQGHYDQLRDQLIDNFKTYTLRTDER